MKLPDVIRLAKSWFADWRSYLVEFLATFAFVFVSLMAAISEAFYGNIGVLGVSLAIGFSYTALVFASSHSGKGYLNPAIVVALWLANRHTHLRAISLIVFQIAASLVAAASMLLVFGSRAYELLAGGVQLGIGIDLSAALAIEAILTAIVTMVVFATAVDRNGPVSFGPWAIGLIMSAATIVALPISGAVLNPARAIGPAVISGSWETLAVWLIGPLAGSLMGLVYEISFLRKGKK